MNTFDINKCFKFRDKQEKINGYSVIYKIKCNCGKNYIKQTKRNLSTRLKDHNPNSNNQETDVTKHVWDNLGH